MIVKLNRDDAPIPCRRIRYDIGKITVQGQQQAFKFLRLGDYIRIRGANRQMIAQQRNFMSSTQQFLGDFARDAMVAEKAKTHSMGTASKSARSRA